jgi:hypothetical protein
LTVPVAIQTSSFGVMQDMTAISTIAPEGHKRWRMTGRRDCFGRRSEFKRATR